MLERSGEHVTSLAFHRAKGVRPFGSGETRQLLLWIPHLRRALAIQRLLARHEALAGGLERAVDTLASPVALLDENRRLVRANGLMEDLLRAGDGLKAVAGRLVAADPLDAEPLKRALAEATDLATGSPLGFQPRVVRLTRRHRDQPLAFHAVPLRAGSGLLGDSAAPRILVLVSDPLRRAVPPSEVLRVVFGLTAAEADVALMIAGGLDPQAIAKDRGVSAETVRRQLKALFSKTGTHRQAEITALLVRMAIGAGGDEATAPERSRRWPLAPGR